MATIGLTDPESGDGDREPASSSFLLNEREVRFLLDLPVIFLHHETPAPVKLAFVLCFTAASVPECEIEDERSGEFASLKVFLLAEAENNDDLTNDLPLGPERKETELRAMRDDLALGIAPSFAELVTEERETLEGVAVCLSE